MQRALQACPAIALRTTADCAGTVNRCLLMRRSQCPRFLRRSAPHASTGSPQALPAANAARRAVQSCGPAVAGPLQRRQRRLRIFTRTREDEIGVRAWHGLPMNQAHPPPDRPRRNPRCAVLAARKAHLAFRPQGCAQMPPCRPCRPDRDAFGPANWASCPPCHHVAAFPDRGSRPPPLTGPRPPFKWTAVSRKPTSEAFPNRSAAMSALLRAGKQLRSSYPTHHSSRHSAEESPGLSAPMRKGCSQSRVRPRKLRVIRFHCVLVVLRPHAVSVAHATGLVALLPFHVPGVPFAAAGIPPHCGVAAARPCIFTPGQSAQRCARSAPRLMSPLRRRPPGAGRVPFCCGTRLARVECLQKEGWGHPIPRLSRAKPAAAAIYRIRHRQGQTVVPHPNRFPRRQASRAPVSAPRPPDARAVQACPHWGRARYRRGTALLRHSAVVSSLRTTCSPNQGLPSLAVAHAVRLRAFRRRGHAGFSGPAPLRPASTRVSTG